MIKENKFTKIYQSFQTMLRLSKEYDINLFIFFLASFLSFIASMLAGISVALLIPAVKGLFEGDFSFAINVPVLGECLRYLFGIFGERQGVMLSTILGLIFICTILKCVLQYLAGLIVASMSLSLNHNLRLKLYSRYLTFGKLFFDRTSYGYLYTVLMNFSAQLSNTFMQANNLLFCLSSLIVFLTIMGFISWQITLFALLIFPGLHFSMSMIIKKIGISSSALAQSSVILNKKISNALTSIPLIKAYTNEDRENKWFSFASERVNTHQYSIKKKELLTSPIHEIVTMIIMFFIIGLMAYMLLKKRTGDIAAYLTFFLMLRRVAGSANVFNDIRKSLARSTGAIQAIKDVFNDNEKFYVKNGTKTLREIEKGLELVSLGFSYPGGISALENINLSIKKGKTVAIVGATGAGKSTIINLVMRFFDASTGSLMVDGIDIKEYTIESLRSNIALVSQDTHLFNASLEVNLKYGSREDITERELMDAIKLARLDDLIDNSPDGLKAMIGERGVQLSGGEKQRVSICRAILKKSNIVLLDEATSALDSVTERKIQEALDDLTKDATTIVVAHRLSTIKNADKIAVIENGRLIEQGDMKSLLEKKGKFCKYWQEQSFF